MKKLGIFVGSLRKDAYTKKIGETVAKHLADRYDVSFLTFNDLPYYDEDLDQDGKVPMEWTEFREEVKGLDAFLFITPEYNRSLPAALKNAIDVASRPYGFNVWDGKPAGIISSSIGNIGGFGANHHLRQVMTFVNVFTMQQPEAYLSNIMDCFDDNGKIAENTDAFLGSYADALDAWFKRF